MANNQGIRFSKTSPAFLHANSTSHTWIFSAIAELIDNAYDPDVGAKTLAIDVVEINNVKCLTFKDDGGGLDLEGLHKMLSFGYCEKVEIGGVKPVGHYGNGFKSGSMRLGKDAIVFTKKKDTMSVGFLSQTYLKQIASDSVIVPIVSWQSTTRRMLPLPQMQENLKAIISYSIFKSAHSLLQELLSIDSKTGTKIVIYNLNRYHSLDISAPQYELDFMSDRDDILNPEMAKLDAGSIAYEVEYKPKYRKSLREYCSILFLKPRLRIMIRGKKVKTKLISKSLSNTETDNYKPRWLDVGIPIFFGFSPSRDEYGMMMYHRNRMIKAFERVGCQKEANQHGVGVVGVIEADFLTPIHNKQDFNKTDRYNALMVALASKLNDYWFEKKCRPESAQNARGNSDNYFILNDAGCIIQDWYWAQCDKCLKWRRLPQGMTDDGLPDKWYCRDNLDLKYNTCEAPEEPIDGQEADVCRASYDKTVKKKKEEEKRMKKAKEEAEKRHSLTKMAQMQRENQKLKKKMMALEKNQPLEEEEEDAGKDGAEVRECKPTVADLEEARKELNDLKKREAKQHVVIRKMQKERKDQEDKESTLKKLCTKAGKKLKKVKDVAPDVLSKVMAATASDSEDDCITLDSDDEGIDFTDPTWMDRFLTDEDRRRDVKPNVEELNKAIDGEKENTQEKVPDEPTVRDSPAEDPVPPLAPQPVNGAIPNSSIAGPNLNSDLFSASDDEDNVAPPSPTHEEEEVDANKEAEVEQRVEADANKSADACKESEGNCQEEADANEKLTNSGEADADDTMNHDEADNDDDEDDKEKEQEDAEADGDDDAEKEPRKSSRIKKGEDDRAAQEDKEKMEEEKAQKEKEKEERAKEKARLEKEKEKEREKERREREKEKERKEKEKEKERIAKEKEKERIAKEKEKERIAKEKEKERIEKEKEKERIAKEKEKERLDREKEKERERREKEREKERQEKLKEKERREKEKEREKKRKEQLKEKERLKKEREAEKENKRKAKEEKKQKEKEEREERKKKALEEGKEAEHEEEEPEEEPDEPEEPEEEEPEEPEPESEPDSEEEPESAEPADETPNESVNETVNEPVENGIGDVVDEPLDSSLAEKRKRGSNDARNDDEDDESPEKKKPKSAAAVADDDEDKSEDLLRFVNEKTKENKELKSRLDSLETQLKDLRANVTELIKIIVPDVQVESMLIDDLVRQVILENKSA